MISESINLYRVDFIFDWVIYKQQNAHMLRI